MAIEASILGRLSAVRARTEVDQARIFEQASVVASMMSQLNNTDATV